MNEIDVSFVTILTTIILLYTMPTLPLDLIDETVGHLKYDIPTLSACSTVCKTWLPSVRRVRHRTVTLDAVRPLTHKHIERLVEVKSVVVPYIRNLKLSLGVGAMVALTPVLKDIVNTGLLEKLILTGGLTQQLVAYPMIQELASLLSIHYLHCVSITLPSTLIFNRPKLAMLGLKASEVEGPIDFGRDYLMEALYVFHPDHPCDGNGFSRPTELSVDVYDPERLVRYLKQNLTFLTTLSLYVVP